VNRLRLGHQPIFVEYGIDFEPRWDNGRGNPHLADILEARRETFCQNLGALARLAPLVEEIEQERVTGSPINWRNPFIPALDALTLMWAAERTRSTVVEVGSGNSTLFLRAAIKHSGRKVRIVSIDPEPRADIDRYCDTVIRQPLEKADAAVFATLEPGDTVFVDSSHRSFMNSDVTVFMLDILPALKPGVLVGFHDIFLPFDYLPAWRERAYNEQYLLACLLIASRGYFDIQFANYWMARQRLHVEPLATIWDLLGPDIRDRPPSAFWGVKVGNG
jgi:hypothetical protein